MEVRIECMKHVSERNYEGIRKALVCSVYCVELSKSKKAIFNFFIKNRKGEFPPLAFYFWGEDFENSCRNCAVPHLNANTDIPDTSPINRFVR